MSGWEGAQGRRDRQSRAHSLSLDAEFIVQAPWDTKNACLHQQPWGTHWEHRRANSLLKSKDLGNYLPPQGLGWRENRKK